MMSHFKIHCFDHSKTGVPKIGPLAGSSLCSPRIWPMGFGLTVNTAYSTCLPPPCMLLKPVCALCLWHVGLDTEHSTGGWFRSDPQSSPTRHGRSNAGTSCIIHTMLTRCLISELGQVRSAYNVRDWSGASAAWGACTWLCAEPILIGSGAQGWCVGLVHPADWPCAPHPWGQESPVVPGQRMGNTVDSHHKNGQQ